MMVFQRCCIAEPDGKDDGSINSFLGPPMSECSRVSKEAYKEAKELDIVYIKTYQKEKWVEYDDGDFSDTFYNKSCTSSRKSTARTSYDGDHVPNKKVQFFTGQSSGDELELNTHRSGKCSTCNSVYIPTSPTHAKNPTHNKFLDWITMCFWKCSPGCQQLPTLKVQ